MNIGLCIRQRQLHVEAQNATCARLCGLQMGGVCRSLCFQACQAPELQSKAATGTYRFANVRYQNHPLDLLVIIQDESVITLLCPVQKPDLSLFSEARLSAREDAILSLMLTGLSRTEIAETLDLSENTVKSHVRHVNNKLSLRGARLLATLKALRNLR